MAKESWRPTSPESGREFEDISQMHALLRGKFREVIRDNAPQGAAVPYLFQMNAAATTRGVKILQDARMEKSEIGEMFLTHGTLDGKFYTALFHILKEFGFPKEAAAEDVAMYLRVGMSFSRPMSMSDRLNAQTLATQVLREVYDGAQ